MSVTFKMTYILCYYELKIVRNGNWKNIKRDCIYSFNQKL